MVFRTSSLGLIVLAYVCGVSASPQMTTALPFGVIDELRNREVFLGVIIGSGADGTTYIISDASTVPYDPPATMTLVENASGLTVYASTSTGDIVAIKSYACGFSGISAECTDGNFLISGSQTPYSYLRTISGIADSITIVVSTSSAPIPMPSQSSDTKEGSVMDAVDDTLVQLPMD